MVSKSQRNDFPPAARVETRYHHPACFGGEYSHHVNIFQIMLTQAQAALHFDQVLRSNVNSIQNCSQMILLIYKKPCKGTI